MLMTGCSSVSLDWTVGPDRLVTGSDVQIAFNNAQAGVRDLSDMLHLVWTDGEELWYGRRDPSTGSWSTAAFSGAAGTAVAKPTVAVATVGGTGTGSIVYVAWVQTGSVDRVMVAKSTDGGGTWGTPTEVATGTDVGRGGVSLYAYVPVFVAPGRGENPPRVDSSDAAGFAPLVPTVAVVAWGDESGNFSYAASSADGWTAHELNDGTSPARNPAIDGTGATVWAVWDENNGTIHVRRSLDGGRSWESEPATTAWALGPSGNDASIAVISDDAFYVAWSTGGEVYFGMSVGAGAHLAGLGGSGTSSALEEGFFPRAAFDGRLILGWEGCSGCGIRDDESKLPYLALGWPWQEGPPDGMPDYTSYPGATLVNPTITDDRVDVFWVEHLDSSYTLIHRGAMIR
jgi:hypothetical protein